MEKKAHHYNIYLYLNGITYEFIRILSIYLKYHQKDLKKGD